MKKQLLLSLLAIASFFYAQSQSCCSKSSATQQFAMLSKDKNFSARHPAPEAIGDYSFKGKMIYIETPDGPAAKIYESLGSKKSKKYLFLFHEYWGLNDNIKKEADNWAAQLGDVTVWAIDLYDGKVATNAKLASQYMQGLSEGRAKTIINTALRHAPKNAQIATIGWCMGGGWSMQAALLAGKRAQACVMYYGMPEEDLSKLKKLNTDVLFVFAQKDQWINDEVMQKFKKNMLQAHKYLSVLPYDADHAFANPSNIEKYNKAYADDAHGKALVYLNKRLK